VEFHARQWQFYGAINFGAINLLLQKMEQFYGAMIWYHLMAPFYGMCVPGIRDISYTSRVIADFVPNFVAMAKGVGRGRICLKSFN